MKIGDFYVEVVEDCGENEGGYYCRLYDNEEAWEQLDGWIDDFCIHPEELEAHGDLKAALLHYLNLPADTVIEDEEKVFDEDVFNDAVFDLIEPPLEANGYHILEGDSDTVYISSPDWKVDFKIQITHLY